MTDPADNLPPKAGWVGPRLGPLERQRLPPCARPTLLISE
jgi:hypothetical protein